MLWQFQNQILPNYLNKFNSNTKTILKINFFIFQPVISYRLFSDIYVDRKKFVFLSGLWIIKRRFYTPCIYISYKDLTTRQGVF